MKKILIYLQSLALTATPILITVSCNKTSKMTKNKLNPAAALSKQEKEIIKNTSLFTKLLLLSRHENLNFNSTDLLNAVFAPKTTWNAFAQNYTVDGKTYNLNEHTEKLTTEYSNLAKLNATTFDPFLTSTLTGMYEDTLYQNYVKQDENKREDIFSFFDKENNIGADNITPVIKLANDHNRQQLAWANFTGPLSKYIADKHILDYQHLNYQSEDARHFYGRFLDATIVRTLPDSKIVKNEDGVNLEGMKINTGEDNEVKAEFGKYQTKIFRNQMKANFSAQVLQFVPFIQNFNESESGSIYRLKLLNSLFPFTDSKTNMDNSYVLFFLLQTSIKWMRQFSVKYRRTNETAQAIWDKAKVLVGMADFPPGSWDGLFKETGIDFFQRISDNRSYDFKVQMLMVKDDKKIQLFKTIKEFKILCADWVVTWTNDMKTDFFNSFKSKIKLLQTLASGLKPWISDLIQKGLDTLESADDIISFFAVLGDMMSVFADNEEKFLAIDAVEGYDNKDFSTLTKSQQQDIATTLGFKNNKFEEGSVLDGLYKVVNNEIFTKMFLSQNSPLYQYNSENIEDIYKDLLQYALDDQYWKIDKKSFKMDGAISGNESLNKKFSYTIKYNGIGDKTVTKFLDHHVELPENFNPIEPWHTPTDVSKDWTSDDYIAYTGLGNKESYDKVNFKYNVEWSNVSGNPEFPYWVITKVDMFRKENGQWKQFYPVM